MRRRTKAMLCLGGFALLLGIAAFIPADVPSSALPIPGLKVSPETTLVTEPLNELGFPDYVQVVDAMVAEGVAPEENFWALFSQQLAFDDPEYAAELKKRPGFERTGRVPFQSSSKANRQTPGLAEDLDNAAHVMWKPAQSPALVDWLSQNEEPLAIAVAASSRPKAYAPVIGNADRLLLGTLLPHAQDSRDVVRALTARATLAMSSKQYDDAWRDIQAAHRIGNFQFRGWCHLESMVGCAIGSVAASTTMVALSNEPGSADAARSRWKAIAPSLIWQVDESRTRRGEAMNLIQLHLANLSGMDGFNDGFGRHHLDSSGRTNLLRATWFRIKRRFERRLMAATCDVNDALRYTTAFLERVQQVFESLTFAERIDAWNALQEEYFGDQKARDVKSLAPSDFWRRSTVLMFAPAMNAHFRFMTSWSQKRILQHAAFAAEIHYRETGVDVESGEQLQEVAAREAAAAGIVCPKIEDLFTPGPVRICKEDGVLFLYSVGPNGVDERGENDDVVLHLVRFQELRPPAPPMAIGPVSDFSDDDLGSLFLDDWLSDDSPPDDSTPDDSTPDDSTPDEPPP